MKKIYHTEGYNSVRHAGQLVAKKVHHVKAEHRHKPKVETDEKIVPFEAPKVIREEKIIYRDRYQVPHNFHDILQKQFETGLAWGVAVGLATGATLYLIGRWLL